VAKMLPGDPRRASPLGLATRVTYEYVIDMRHDSFTRVTKLIDLSYHVIRHLIRHQKINERCTMGPSEYHLIRH